MNESTRAWIYRIATATIALLVVYGILDGEQAAGWTLWAAAVMAVPVGALAAAHTSTKNDQP
ncbi:MULTISPECIES: hypothetical protein [unclassified Egicoccus]|uniref:phage holin n=1 Tax=unclassified Egicoccus TaxID=2635606 RepID=UPI00359E9F2E